MVEGVPVSATDNYTPKTDAVRRSYWYNTSASDSAVQSDAEFDRWLAAERAKAWDESMTTADIWYQERLAGIPPTGRYPANPYREVQ